MTKVKVDEIAAMLARGEDITIIDARAENAWSGSGEKAAGAIRISPEEAESHLADVSRDKFAVAYCT